MISAIRSSSSSCYVFLKRQNYISLAYYNIQHSDNEIKQIDYLNSQIKSKSIEWARFKREILSKKGHMTAINFDAVFLKHLISQNNYEHALSYGDHLRSSEDKLTMGSINGLLELYYKYGNTDKLADKDREFIHSIHKQLYKKYKVLDNTTSENLLCALCTIGEWDKCYKILDDIKLLSTPSHLVYNTFIATLFNHDKRCEAMDLIKDSLAHNRPLMSRAYSAWIQYHLRKHEQSDKRIKHLNEVMHHITNNFVILDKESAMILQNTYNDLGWNSEVTKINRLYGQCDTCKQNLQLLKLSLEEFQILQDNVKNKLIIGSDLFLNTNPDEFNEFTKKFKATAPYDIVVDGLNVAYSAHGASNKGMRANFLRSVIYYLKQQGMKIFLLGRKHMLTWPQRPMNYIMDNTHNFFTDNVSEDDPYFISAAILSGYNTDIVSKDLLRGHKYKMKDIKHDNLFLRWQWQHQWKVTKNNNDINFLKPLSFSPCAQNNGDGWHIPFYCPDVSTHGLVKEGYPDWNSWLCLKPPL